MPINGLVKDLEGYIASPAPRDPALDPSLALGKQTLRWSYINNEAMLYAPRNALYRDSDKAALKRELLAAYKTSATVLSSSSFTSLGGSEPEEIVRKQAEIDEPVAAVCDAVLYRIFQFDETAEDVTGSTEREIMKAIESFRCLIAEPSLDPSTPVPPTPSAPAAESGTTATPIEPPMDPKGTRLKISSINAEAAAIEKHSTSPAIPPQKKNTFLRDVQIFFPVFFVEYKRPSLTYVEALDQAKSYLASASAFYAAAGIIKYPVFALAVDGCVGYLLMGWRSEDGVRVSS